jgi:hypothetical protein
VPFPAQLRIWDVFMLLGDSPPVEAAGTTDASSDATKASSESQPLPGLDILHAASAALMHGLRDVLLDSDFENAMKALTSWVPVKDEALLMKVTKSEWKARHGKKRKSS